MRVAYITETFPPEINGVALTTARTVQHLRQAGHAVQLIRPRQPHETSEGSQVPAEGDHTFDNGEWRTAGAPIPMYPGLRFGWATASALRERWRAARPDIVHVATPGPLAHSALRAARAEGIPTSADFRTNFHAYSRHYRLGWLQPAVLAYLRGLHGMADRSFVPTPSLCDELGAAGFERLRVVGRGVDAGQFSPLQRDAALREAWGAAPQDRVLLYVGRLAAEKNVALALDTFEVLRPHHPGLRMVVAGEGPQRARLAAEHPDVCFVGLQRGAALARCYASADVFLFPSLTDTFGNVTLEALASGLAVVAFDSAAAGELMESGHNGFLVPPDSRAGFMQATRQAIAHADPAGALRQRARRLALLSDWETALRAFEQELADVVDEVTGRQAPGRPAVA